jgi:NAD(P)-dependent dehydrogenase (short-subunit alcohol dehydrogenase family)
MEVFMSASQPGGGWPRIGNRTGIVTGASRGLGRVIAGVLAERGFRLVVNARNPGPLVEAADSLRRSGATVVEVAGDVTDADVRRRMIAAARELGGLDVLVNNASDLGVIGPLMDFDVQRFGRVFPVNAGAPIALVQLAVPLLAERHGLIVNVTSDAANGAYAGWGPYGASKAALELLTRTLATELKDRGVSAVIVDPGDMRTRMHQDAFPGEDISDRPLPDVTAPFWRWLFDQTPSDISGERFVAQKENERWLQQA